MTRLFVESSSTFFIFFDDDAYAFMSTRRNFFHDDARDSTSTTSRCFFHDVGHYNSTILAPTSNTSIFDTFSTVALDVEPTHGTSVHDKCAILAPNVGPSSNISILNNFAIQPPLPLNLPHGWFPALRFRWSVAVSLCSATKVRKNYIHL